MPMKPALSHRRHHRTRDCRELSLKKKGPPKVLSIREISGRMKSQRGKNSLAEKEIERGKIQKRLVNRSKRFKRDPFTYSNS